MFLIIICTTYFFKRYLRLVLVTSIIIIFSALLTVECLYPQWIVTYSEQSQFFDRLFQIPLSGTAAYVFYLFLRMHTLKKEEDFHF